MQNNRVMGPLIGGGLGGVVIFMGHDILGLNFWYTAIIAVIVVLLTLFVTDLLLASVVKFAIVEQKQDLEKLQ